MNGRSAVRPAAAPTYGRGLLSRLPRDLLRQPAVFTQPEPWLLVSSAFPAERTGVHRVSDTDHNRVRDLAGLVSERSAVFGIGGGSALDAAKYAAWAGGLPLVLVPTVLSVDAAFTRAAAVREGARVRYVGDAVADHLLVDFGLLEQAPPQLNRAGSADVLSIYTALWDWREASRRRGERWSAGLALQSQALLARLLAGAAEIRRGSEAGLHLLAELFVAEVAICEEHGNARPEEGSEHYLAYCIERLTQRAFIHGQLVGLCIDLVARIQGQPVAAVRTFLEEVGLDCSLESVGMTRAELREALLHVTDFVAEEGHLLPGVFHFRPALTEAEADALLADLP